MNKTMGTLTAATTNNAADKKSSKTLEKYLSQVDEHLKYLPVSEKTDILAELKSSFYERLNDGQTEESIVAEMESPKALALNYVGESFAEHKSFSFKRFVMLVGFYCTASIVWMSIIPTLAVLAVSFFLSSSLSILAGVMGLLKGSVRISGLEHIQFMLFSQEITGFPALLVGMLLAIIFAVLGLLCWKGAVSTVRLLQAKSWELK